MSSWFRIVPPNEDPPPPPPELKEWAQGTAYGILFGMAYGAYVTTNSSTFPIPPISSHLSSESTPSPTPSASATVDGNINNSKNNFNTPLLNSKHRIERLIRGITMHGVRIGSFASCFTAIQLYSKSSRDVDDYLNYVLAGGVTSGLTGLSIPGNRAKGLVYGLVFGSSVCVPIGYMMEESTNWLVEKGFQSSHKEKRREYEEKSSSKENMYKGKNGEDVTMKVIERLERELNESMCEDDDQRLWWKFWRLRRR